MDYQALCIRCGWLHRAETWDGAATRAAIHRTTTDDHKVVTLAICPNCEHARHGGDCMNDCASRGFAPIAGPETLNL